MKAPHGFLHIRIPAADLKRYKKRARAHQDRSLSWLVRTLLSQWEKAIDAEARLGDRS